jgi:hypothetical protein
VLVALAFVACGSSDAELVVPEAPRDVSAEASGPVYLALGDSLAVGIGARDWAIGGYVGLLHSNLNADRAPADAFALRKVARSGADMRLAIEDGNGEFKLWFELPSATASELVTNYTASMLALGWLEVSGPHRSCSRRAP